MASNNVTIWNDVSTIFINDEKEPRNINLYVIYAKFVPELFIMEHAFAYLNIVICVFGIPGNLLSFILWLQKDLVHSSGFYLSALGLSNFVTLALLIVYDLDLYWGFRTFNNGVTCEGFAVVYMTVQYLSPLFTLGFTVERFISVRLPLKRHIYCSVKKAIIIICIMVATAFAIGGMQAYIWEYNDRSGECEVEMPKLWETWTWITETILFILIPVIILVFNVLVIVTIKHSRQSSRHMYSSTPQEHNSATTMLLAVSFIFIFTTLPVTVIHSFHEMLGPGTTFDNIESDPVWTRHFQYIVIDGIAREFGILHYATNFYVYLVSGKRLRNQIKSLIRKICKM